MNASLTAYTVYVHVHANSLNIVNTVQCHHFNFLNVRKGQNVLKCPMPEYWPL